MIENILIIGSGGHATSCIDVIESENRFKIAGIITNEKIHNFNGYQILGMDSDLPDLRKKFNNVLIGIGQLKDPKKRKNIFNLLKKLDYNLPTIIAPTSYVSKRSVILEGTIIMHNAFVNSNVKIGNNCIINSHANIEHDVKIEDNCHISTGAMINGNCIIESGSFIGSNATLHQNINIKKNSIILAARLDSKNN